MVHRLTDMSRADRLFPEFTFLEGARVFMDDLESPENGVMMYPLDHRPYYDATWDVRLKAKSPDAACELLEALPSGNGYFIVLEKDELRSCVETILSGTLVGGQVYYMVDNEHFIPASPIDGLDIRLLTPDDAGIIATYPDSAVAKHYAMMLAGLRECRNFGGFVNGRMVSFCNVSMDWEAPEVLWVHTREEERGKGYAKRIVTEVTRFALAQRERIYYTVDLDNIASAHTCEALGYYRRGQIYSYVGRK